MGYITLTKNDQVTPELQAKIEEILGKASDTMDDIGDIYKDYMQELTPIGETQDLYDATFVDSDGQLKRTIYSAMYYFDCVVGGHAVYGPIFSDLQRRWWFWYLYNVLGGVYENKTNGFQPPNDYPQEAFDNAQMDVDVRLDEFVDWIAE